MNSETKKIMDELDGVSLEKAELEELRRDKKLKENLEAELEILREVFPDLSADDIPDEVFEGCDNGKGLASQYALYYLKSKKLKEETDKTNLQNSMSAPPEISGDKESVFYTPEAVRAMSEKDIRRHYKDIMKSMEKWNNK